MDQTHLTDEKKRNYSLRKEVVYFLGMIVSGWVCSAPESILNQTFIHKEHPWFPYIAFPVFFILTGLFIFENFKHARHLEKKRVLNIISESQTG